MRRYGWLAAACLLAATGLAWAQEVGEPAPDLYVADERGGRSKDSLPLQKRYPNRIIVLFYFSTMDSRSEQLFPMMKQLDEKYGPRGVMIVGLTRENLKSIENRIKEAQITFPVNSIIGLSTWRFPAPPLAYIIDLYGRVQYARFDPTEGLEEKIQTVLERTPPPTATPERLKAFMDQLSKWIDESDFARAYSGAKLLKDFFIEGQEEEEASIDELLVKIALGIEQQLEQAGKEIQEEKYEEASRTLAALSIRLQVDDDEKQKGKRRPATKRRPPQQRGKTATAGPVPKSFKDLKEKVETEIGRMQGDNYQKAIILKALDNARGEVRNDQAAELVQMGQFGAARDLYRSVVDDFDGTPAAETAAAAIEKLATDPELRKAVAQAEAAQQAQRWYDLADRYARAGLFDPARTQLEKLVKEYPSSAVAQDARARLVKLPDEAEKFEESRRKREAIERTAVSEEKKDK